jgi:putative transferase (TIGR04331 family)
LNETEFLPKDFLMFQRWQPLDDYNLYLFSLLIKDLGGISFELQNVPWKLEQIPNQTGVNFGSQIKEGVKRVLEVYYRFIPQKLNEIVMVSLYMRAIDLFRLQISLGQLPCPYTPMVSPPKVAPDFELRKNLEISNEKNEFEFLLVNYIPKQMPTAYLESYAELKKEAMRVFPKNPKVIIYVNSNFTNEGFKIWSADRMEKETKLLGMPHGAHYGNALWSANETHEKKLADQYFSWGWEDKEMSHVTPFASVQLAGVRKSIRVDPQGGILWLGMSRPRYLNWMISAPMGCEMLEYVEDQKIFLRALGSEAKNILTMRLFHTDYGWGVRERLMEGLPDLRFSDEGETMFQQLCKSRLCIASYNATPILGTLSANFPTIAFWNFDHWELRDSAIPCFDDMVRAGIFHNSAESAARKVNEIYEDPMSWWLSLEIQEVRSRFCDRFARTSPNWLSEWKKELFRISGK